MTEPNGDALDGLPPGIQVTVSPERVRTYYSVTHIQTAYFFSKMAAYIEGSGQPLTTTQPQLETKFYATGAVFSSVAFLEASINEFCADAAEGLNTKLKDWKHAEAEQLIGDLWTPEMLKKVSMEQKYQVVLRLAGRERIVRNEKPGQDVAALVTLRNELVHYEPEWVMSDADSKHDQAARLRVERALIGKFDLSAFTTGRDPFFPERCMSAGCAIWAVQSSVYFADAFFERMELRPPYADAVAEFYF